MNKQMTFTVTLLDNRYGDNIRTVNMTWQDLMNRVQNPPSYKTKGKDGIIGGKCEWEDSIATTMVDRWEYVFDHDGEFVIDENGKKKRECKQIEQVKKDWNGKPIKRAKNGTIKAINRQFLFIDCDSIEDVNRWMNDVYAYKEFWGWAFAIYSSFSATAEKPRYRVVFPMSRPVTPDEYKRIARGIMYDLDEMNCDPESDRSNRIMFLPEWPLEQDPVTKEWKRGYYKFIIEDDDGPMDVDEYLRFLDTYSDIYARYQAPVRTKTGEPVERILRKCHERKQATELSRVNDR